MDNTVNDESDDSCDCDLCETVDKIYLDVFGLPRREVPTPVGYEIVKSLKSESILQYVRRKVESQFEYMYGEKRQHSTLMRVTRGMDGTILGLALQWVKLFPRHLENA
jgi:hypothetical protein